MRTELVTIRTDTLPLDGAFYEPAGGATAGGVLLFHGNTMNFYVGAPRFLPPALTALGFACLAFNRAAMISSPSATAAPPRALRFKPRPRASPTIGSQPLGWLIAVSRIRW